MATVYYIYRYSLARKQRELEALRLRELDRLKNNMYANITHEFRTPITVIQGLAEELSEESQNTAQVIKRNANRLLDLVNQILELTKLKDGKPNIDWVQIDVMQWLAMIMEGHQWGARKKNITLDLDTDPHTLILDIDPDKLQPVLSNLIDNAIKYVPDGGHIWVKARTKTDGAHELLEISVADDGKGIPESQLALIFDRYYRTQNEHASGFGIGLNLANELMEMMGGTLTVDSKLGVGSTFKISLPIQHLATHAWNEDGNGRTKHNHAPVSSNLIKENNIKNDFSLVQIIEDNADVRNYIEDCLKERFRVITSQNGRQGLQQAQEVIPDAVVTDIMMPEMDGFTLLQRLKQDERTNHIPVVLLTARVTKEDKIKGFVRGADAYVTKPFNKVELQMRLQQLLDTRKLLQSKYSVSIDDGAQSQQKEDPFLLKVKTIVLQKIQDQELSIALLAKELHLSTSQVYRKIKAVSGYSTSHFIRHIRLERARHYLQTTTQTISEVAYLTGFSSLAYFSKVFKETYQKSPKEYRDQRREKCSPSPN